MFIESITTEFSETQQLTQRKSKRLIEGFVRNPLELIMVSLCEAIRQSGDA
ncbi:MAG: hypothetical protein ABL888_17300 [Pirellulaceae bacterium]